MKNLNVLKGTDYLLVTSTNSDFQFTIPFDKVDYLKLVVMPEAAKERLAVNDHVVICVEGKERKLFAEKISSPAVADAEALYDQLFLWIYDEVQPTPTPTP